MTYIERIIDTDGTVTDRPFTAQEIESYEKEKAEKEQMIAAEQAEAEAKATARQALLDRLGITQEEATLLLGGN